MLDWLGSCGSGRREGACAPPLWSHLYRARGRGGLRLLLVVGWPDDLCRLGDEELLDSAAEHPADDVEIIELDAGRPAGPQAGHLAGTHDQATFGKQALQLAGLPDATVGGGQPEVPLHGRSPFSRSAARWFPAIQASSTCVRCTWTYCIVVATQQ